IIRLVLFLHNLASNEIYTLSLHDALPIYSEQSILKPEHFQISIIRGEIERRMDTGNTDLEHRIRIKRLSNDAILPTKGSRMAARSEEHTSELQSRGHLVCRLLLEKKKKRR